MYTAAVDPDDATCLPVPVSVLVLSLTYQFIIQDRKAQECLSMALHAFVTWLVECALQ